MQTKQPSTSINRLREHFLELLTAPRAPRIPAFCCGVVRRTGSREPPVFVNERSGWMQAMLMFLVVKGFWMVLKSICPIQSIFSRVLYGCEYVFKVVQGFWIVVFGCLWWLSPAVLCFFGFLLRGAYTFIVQTETYCRDSMRPHVYAKIVTFASCLGVETLPDKVV